MLRLLPPLLLAAACETAQPLPSEPGAFAFARMPDSVVDLQLSPNNRPGDGSIPEQIAVREAFKPRRTEDGVVEYDAGLPVREVFRGHSTRKAPAGFEVLDPDGEERTYQHHDSGKLRAGTWDLAGDRLRARVEEGHKPVPGRWIVRYQAATDGERSLNLLQSGESETDFVFRSMREGGDARRGIYLPAPSSAAWTVKVPTRAVLELDATIVPSWFVDGHHSDGAALAIELLEGDEVVTECSFDLATGKWAGIQLELGRWAGHELTVRFATRPGKSSDLDYVFLAEPTLYTPEDDPPRLAIVFIDTLRADHLGIYGREPSPTPTIDQWSKGAAVFSGARSTSPWTLPSARAMLSGRHPDDWYQATSLAAHLAKAGWATAAFSGNAFLHPTFDMGNDWGTFRYELLRPAVDVVRLSEDFLDAHPDRPVAVLAHFMDVHLPYTEPEAVREHWEQVRPSFMPERQSRSTLRGLDLSPRQREEAADYLSRRYDDNLARLDGDLLPLLDRLGDKAVVVLVADHGEELWDHGDIEHGHALYEELVRVPLVIKAPGLAPTTIAAPVSLMDVVPTVLDLLDLPLEGLNGTSLVPAARGEAAALEALQERPLAFGQLLYGSAAWGVARGDHKWVQRDGTAHLYDLAADPGEHDDLVASQDVDSQVWTDALGQALGRPVVPVWRVSGPGDSKSVLKRDLSMELSHPDGLVQAWHAFDPTGDQANPVVEDGVVRVAATDLLRVPRELYLRSEGPLVDAGLQLDIHIGSTDYSAVATGQGQGPVLSLDTRIGTFKVEHDQVPVPAGAEGIDVGGEALEDLKALGYVE